MVYLYLFYYLQKCLYSRSSHDACVVLDDGELGTLEEPRCT